MDEKVTVTMPLAFWNAIREVIAEHSMPAKMGQLMLNTWDEVNESDLPDLESED
jgi:hypothetical protein